MNDDYKIPGCGFRCENGECFLTEKLCDSMDNHTCLLLRNAYKRAAKWIASILYDRDNDL